MKKVILSVFICVLAFSTATNATAIKLEKEPIRTVKVGYSVSTFCKLIQMGNYTAVKSLIETYSGSTSISRREVSYFLSEYAFNISFMCSGSTV